MYLNVLFFFFSSRRRHTRSLCDWSSDVCSSDLALIAPAQATPPAPSAHPSPVQDVVQEPSRPFDEWLTDLIADARSRGFSDDVINDTLAGLQPRPRVVERDRSQA